MANIYNPYSDIQKVYNAKVAWNKATTDEERKRQNEIATAARKNLEAYGYSDVANQISASGADATVARKIMEKYAPTVTDTNTSTKSPVETNNLKSNEINRENAGLFDKYNDTYDNLTKTNPFKTDEAKAILGKYDLASLQARDNAVASGSATNGGNIDSYASANAMRQQTSIINQGQKTVLESHKQKIDNVRGLLSDIGVNIDRVFNQDETAKNNDVARKSEIASVTGYTPTEWTYDNNIYLNADGTVKAEFMTAEFDATGGFSTIINNAKAKLATTTDATERSNLEATIKAATQAKALKTFSSPKYSQYAHEVTAVPLQQTEAGRQFDEQNATSLKALETEKEVADAANKNAIDQINAQTEGNKALMEHESKVGGVVAEGYDDVVNAVMSQINNKYGSGTMYNKGRGQYGLSKMDTATIYGIFNIIENSALTVDEATYLMEQLGIIDKYAEYQQNPTGLVRPLYLPNGPRIAY